MKSRLLIFLCFIAKTIVAQDLDIKIDSLRWMSSGEGYGERISTARRILEIDPLNQNAHEYIVNSYVHLEEYQMAYSYIDSILAIPNPNPQVILSLSYGLRHMAPEDSIYDFYYFRVLRSCLGYTETHSDAAYFLSYTYYSDFIKPFEKEPPTRWKWELDSASQYEWDEIHAELSGIPIDSLRKTRSQIKIPESVYRNSADSAVKYLKVLSNSDSPYNQIAKIPIAQIVEYLGVSSKYQLDSNLYNNHYFPEWYFGYLGKDWKYDLSTDLFDEMLFASYGSVDFLSEHLHSLNEPILYPSAEQLTYRISWLPSFDHPIVIRIIKSDSGGKIIWKVGSGMGGYQSEGILVEGEDTLSLREFERISVVLDSTEICSDQHYDYLLMTDGASLIIEKVSEDQFCAHETNVPDEGVKNLLVELAQTHFSEIETGIEDY